MLDLKFVRVDEIGMLDQIFVWMRKCQVVVDQHYHKNYPNVQPPTLQVSVLRKYARIVSADSVQQSAWAFVNLKTGDILKPKRWDAPLKHSRGNIFDDSQGMSMVTPHGPAYLI